MNERVLLVEDDPVTRRVLESTIRGAGFEVVTTDRAEKAWSMLRSKRDIRIVITDWMLPGMDGLELCRRVREDDDEYRYVLVMTGTVGPSELHVALDAGADDVLAKPIMAHDLGARLRAATRMIRRSRSSSSRPIDGIVAALRAGDGELVVRSDEISARVFVLGGRIAWIHVAGRPSSLPTIFGGAVGVEEARSVVEESRRSGASFDRILVEWGLLDATEVRARLRGHLNEALAAILQCASIDSVFVPSDRMSASTPSFSLEELVAPSQLHDSRSSGRPMTSIPPLQAFAAPCLDGTLRCRGCGSDSVVSLSNLLDLDGVVAVSILHAPSGESIGRTGLPIPVGLGQALLQVARTIPDDEHAQEVLLTGSRCHYVLCATGCSLARVVAVVDRSATLLGQARYGVEAVAFAIEPGDDAPGERRSPIRR